MYAHCTSPLAWHCTLSTLTSTSTESAHHERAQSCSLCTFHHTHIGSSSSLVRTSSSCHPCERCLFDSTYSTFYFPAFLLSVFLFTFFHLSDEQQPELNKKIMEHLCNSATNGSEGTYDALYLATGYEPNGRDFNKLQNSSVPLSFKIPATDQDVDDLTLGEMLTEACQSVSCRRLQGSTDQGNLMSVTARKHRLGLRTLLEEQRQIILADCNARVSHRELQSSSSRRRARTALRRHDWHGIIVQPQLRETSHSCWHGYDESSTLCFEQRNTPSFLHVRPDITVKMMAQIVMYGKVDVVSSR